MLSGPQMDEFMRRCELTSSIEAEARRAGYVLYKLPRVENPADMLMAMGEVKREEGEDCFAFAEILKKLKSGRPITEDDKEAFEKECMETIARRAELIASARGL